MSGETGPSAFFVAGGTLRLGVPSYVNRSADDELFKLALEGEYCYVLTPRQMGKSSLMVRTARRLREHSVTTAILDLTFIGSEVSPEQWYVSLLSQLKRRLRVRADPVAWWQERASLSNVQRFTDFFREVVLSEVEGPIVVFVDEIDATLNLDFRDEFFAGIRALYNARAGDAECPRLTFVLLGVASPSDLIHDTALTPFNIGQGLALEEFSHSDARVLLNGLESAHPGQGEAILGRILYWTSGHPYLTQRLCLAAAESSDGHWSDERVDDLVKGLFLSEEARKETNLQFAQNKILTHPNRRRLLALYKKVVGGKRIPHAVQAPIQTQLKLSGIVKAQDGALCVRNEIYRQVFGPDWVRENMPVNWALRIAILSTALLVILGALLGYRWSQRGQQTAEAQAQAAIQDFTTVSSPDVRINSLSKLFQLPGYEGQARELFYSELTAGERIGLFEQVRPQGVEAPLIAVVRGLYTDLGNDDQGNALLEAMAQPLRELDDPVAVNLATECEQWRTGREYYTQGEYRQAVVAYDAAVRLNPNNSGTHFDLGLAYAALDETGDALAHLAKVVALSEGRREEVKDVIVASSQLYGAWWNNQGAYPELAGLVPTPTHTPTPTDTPTPTSTPTSTHTPIWTDTPPPTASSTAAPTDTPIPTSTPSPAPSSTAAPTNTRIPTSTPSPTARVLPAPTPIAPPNGASFTGWNAQVTLTWSGVGSLDTDEYYVVRIPYNESGEVAEFWRKSTSLDVPAHFSLATVGFSDRHYDWSVQVMRCTSNCDKALDDNARKQGIVAGGKSSTRMFYWHPDIGGPPPPPTLGPGETPSPTRPPTPTPP